MSGSHKEFPKKAVFIQLGLAALVGAGFLFADKPAAHAMAEKVEKPIVTAAAKVLAPIGKVEVKEEKMASAARSGKEIYASTCGVCHDNGVAGSPKLDAKADWETRLSGGFAALVTSAIKGKGGMPARGGNPDITDSEMELVVSHMIKTVGIDLVARSSKAMAAPAAQSKPAMKAEEAPKVEEKPAMAMKAEEAPKVEEKPVMAMKAEEAPEVEEKSVMEAKTEEVIEKVMADDVAMATKAVVDHSAGEGVYKNSCSACHDSGVANSPKLGDKAAWAPRLALGSDHLYQSAIKGIGAMPAKGGNTSISDVDVKAAVDYMAAKSM